MAKSPQVDFLVMGAGVAGLRAAVELARHGEVLVVTKESLSESNTHYAQGGIAVAMEGDEDVALHLEDTVNAGDGLVYRPAAEALVSEGPLRVAELIEWGANFDRARTRRTRPDGQFLRTREGAHSLARILHASGDATGAEISRSLVAFARAHKRIRFAEWTRVTGLVVADGRVVAADLASAEPRRRNPAAAVYARRIHASARAPFSSPPAARARSTPTPPIPPWPPATASPSPLRPAPSWPTWSSTSSIPPRLRSPGAPRFLVSEALRGEGAYLRNDRGERFMERYHPLLELAPRDVVARAIAREGMATAAAGSALRPVYLDMRHVRNIDLTARFPGISAFLAQYGLDLRRDLIPVRPAAHYLMGGIRTDLGGRTTLRRPLRRRRSRLHRRARRQSPGLQLPARRPRLRRARRAVHACRRAAARTPPMPHAGAAPEPLSQPEEAARRRSHRRAASLHVGPCRPAARGVFAAPGPGRAGRLRSRAGRDLPQPASDQPPPGRSAGHEPRRPRHPASPRSPAPRAAAPTSATTIPSATTQHFKKHSVLGRDGRVGFEEW